MANVIEQIVQPGKFGSQTIEMVVRSNERGPQGVQGDPGDAATINAGTAYTIEYGKQPVVMNSGTSSNATFDFYIPEGKPGAIHYTAGPGINITDDNRIEATGEMAVYWGDLVGSMSNQTDLMNALNAKQDNLTAGANVQINNNTISATDTTYTAGTNVSISDQNVISATDTTYNDFVGSTSTLAGTNGLVPAPATTVKDGVLKASGIWGLVESTNIANNAVSTDKIAGEAVTAAKLDKQSVIDLFYPVGSYYETSDTSFNPNTAWGGTWVEDSAGRVTVAKDAGTFSNIGSTGGNENHTHQYGFQYAGFWQDTILEGTENVGILNYDSSGNIGLSGHGDIASTSIATINGSTVMSRQDQNVGRYRMTANVQYVSNLQPYVVVKRWHRTA